MNIALSAIGIARQASGKGTAATVPAFWHGVTGGKMVDFGVEQKEAEETTGLAAGVGEYRESISVGADYSFLLKPKLIGAYLQAILGGLVTTGASAPYTHTIKLADTVAYFTLFGKLDGELRTAADCKLDELKFEWDGNGPVKCNATWAGCTPAWAASLWTPTNDETLATAVLAGTSGNYFKYDIDGTSPAAAKILGGSISLKRSVEADIISGSISPDDVNESALKAETELKVRAASLADQRAILTGTAGGTTVSGTPLYGSFDHKFVESATSLVLLSNKAAWQAETPEADPKGGPVELALKASMYIPSGGDTPLTATLINAIAAY